MARYTVGLTGGIASGKSLVAQMFKAHGVPVLDADQVSRTVVEPGQPALREIAERFGTSVLLPDGQLDRRRMREIVFADPQARLELEHITHPRIRQYIREWLDAQQAPYCILENAILFESGMDALVDRVVVVDVPEALQRLRLVDRDGVDPVLVDRMMAAQSPRELRRARADDIVENTGTVEETADAVRRLHATYLTRAAAARGDSGTTTS